MTCAVLTMVALVDRASSSTAQGVIIISPEQRKVDPRDWKKRNDMTFVPSARGRIDPHPPAPRRPPGQVERSIRPPDRSHPSPPLPHTKRGPCLGVPDFLVGTPWNFLPHFCPVPSSGQHEENPMRCRYLRDSFSLIAGRCLAGPGLFSSIR